MNEFGFGSRDRFQKRKVQRNGGNQMQYLLSSEEQILQLISSRAPLPGVLNGICIALDCQIGNVVSLICLPAEDASEPGAIAANAALFGLYILCSEGIVGENDELLGTLEMYCSDRRSPSADDLHLIERAKCLAGIAIRRQNEADERGNRGVRGERPVRALECPVSVN
jgi:hypothetical protein